MQNVDALRDSIRTAISCAMVYRRRRPSVARAQLTHARDLRDRLYNVLARSPGYVVSA